MTSDSRNWNDTDADAVRRVAVPISKQDGGFDPSVVLDLIGQSGVIGLGEPTHGDAETLALKLAIIQHASDKASPLLVAWERGIGHIRHVIAHLRERGSLSAAERRWIYPWVSKEAEALFLWISSESTNRKDQITLCGVDMDGLAPPGLFEEMAARLDLSDDPTWTHACNLMHGLRRSVPKTEACRELYDAVTHLLASPPISGDMDQLIMRATRQWAEFNLIALGANRGSQYSGMSANEFRDTCMSENLSAQMRIHHPMRTIFSAHNGHISRDARMAGGRLIANGNSDYTAVGISFGRGTFNAGTGQEVGFDPKLREFHAARPPTGSLEDLMLRTGLASACIDLRSLRDTSHPLAQMMSMREASLAGGVAQFDLKQVPAEYYDILIWLDEISASQIQRAAGDYW